MNTTALLASHFKFSGNNFPSFFGQYSSTNDKGIDISLNIRFFLFIHDTVNIWGSKPRILHKNYTRCFTLPSVTNAAMNLSGLVHLGILKFV